MGEFKRYSGVLVKHKFDYNYLSDGSIVVGGRL